MAEMVMLQATGNIDQKPSLSSSLKAASMRGNRRKRSKGTIAGFASGKDSSISVTSLDSTSDLESVISRKTLPIGSSSSVVSSMQHGKTEVSPPAPLKPSTFARIALLAAQNAIRLGARTQLNLCPPGRARRDLQSAFIQKNRIQQQQMQNMSARNKMSYSSEGYFSLEKLVGSDTLEDYEVQEEDYLLNTNTFEVDSDEEASSGDEDDLCDIGDLSCESLHQPVDYEMYLKMKEPLYAPVGSESNVGNSIGINTAGNNSGKLPFNRRKLRYFDSITAEETTIVRSYLRKEAQKCKLRSSLLLKRHLRRIQWDEKKKRQIEKGESVDDYIDADFLEPQEAALIDGGVSPFEQTMTPAVAASFLTESLALNVHESIEGMAKCYDGIVAAGVAVLDAMAVDPTCPPSADDKSRPTRAEIISALAPLLITTLDQPSGEVILMLAKLRRMCGTDRYRRRFVQRVAPCLIRPPNGAMWCLRHQNDMAAILAAAELILDSAFNIFSKGWYERGQLLLADSKRAETLSTAAKQLRNLSSETSDGLALGFTGHISRNRRMNTVETTTNEPLAEWEVIAVDKQIRISISNIMLTDWTLAMVNEIPKASNRRSVSAGRRSSGIQPGLEMSPRGIITSPSKAASYIKGSLSPPTLPLFGLAGFDSASSINTYILNDRSESPPPSTSRPASPPASQRTTELKAYNELNGGKSPPNVFSTATPPKSPKSPLKSNSDNFRELQPSVHSPKRSRKEYQIPKTPLSPSAATSGTGISGDALAFKPSSTTSPVTSAAGHTSHYRMLTSTAAERKRTVAACRALRAQIQRFEDAFIQLHGRPPKGASDRAPLATTYAQYREWKRAIRADAACRIQALFRGARTRWKLLRGNNARITRVIMTAAGRPGYSATGNVMNQISIPSELGHVEQEGISSISMAPTVDAYLASRQVSDQQWSSQIVPRRPGKTERGMNDGFQSSPLPKSFSSTSTSTQPEVTILNFAELQSRKRELKQQLKQYDMNFARKHGRMPVKSEKEPIRHLYEAYNSLKHQIGVFEDEGRSQQSSAASPLPNPLPQRNVSPPSVDVGANGNDSENTSNKTNPLLARSKRKVPKSVSPPIAASSPAVTVSSLSTGGNNPGTPDLAALKAEKSTLHQMLRAYEKDFFKEHRRQVSSFADIRPVASQYRRYKDIKKAIAAVQQGGER